MLRYAAILRHREHFEEWHTGDAVNHRFGVITTGGTPVSMRRRRAPVPGPAPAAPAAVNVERCAGCRVYAGEDQFNIVLCLTLRMVRSHTRSTSFLRHRHQIQSDCHEQRGETAGAPGSGDA